MTIRLPFLNNNRVEFDGEYLKIPIENIYMDILTYSSSIYNKNDNTYDVKNYTSKEMEEKIKENWKRWNWGY